jgi:16S rRNA processing protein RimM
LPNRPILLGVIGRAHGVRGLVRVTSHTADPADLTGYGPLSDPSGRRFALRWEGEGIAEIAEIINGEPVKVADRTTAERLTNTKLFIERDQLPPPEPDEYYLADLIGLAAIGTDGSPIGVVSAVHDYGAGVSLEIDRDNAASLLVPFTAACVPEVNIAAGSVTVVPPDEIDVPETNTHSLDERGHDALAAAGSGQRETAA